MLVVNRGRQTKQFVQRHVKSLFDQLAVGASVNRFLNKQKALVSPSLLVHPYCHVMISGHKGCADDNLKPGTVVEHRI